MATDAIFAPLRKRPRILDRPLRGIVRGTAFMGKELHEVLRQPRLLIGLVIGPFLILLLFGSAFQGQITRQPTVLVIPQSTNLSANKADYDKLFQFPFTLEAVVRSPEEAQQLIANGSATITITIPEDAYPRIRAGQHPSITVNYDQIEPVRADQFRFYSYTEVNELNRRLLISVVNQAKDSDPNTARPPLQGFPEAMQTQTTQYNDAVQARDISKAQGALAEMTTLTLGAQNDIRTRVRLYEGIERYFNAPPQPNSDFAKRQTAVESSLTSIETIIGNQQTRLPQQVAAAAPDTRASDDLLANSRAATENAQALQLPPADVLVAPFQAEIENRAPKVPGIISFYGPAVLALLLQHISITLTALTLVRERTVGATQLFRVSPSATIEIMVGKFIGYAFIAGIIGAVLAVLLKYTLNVPMRGSIVDLVVMIALLIAASLGLGFVISAISRTETQAVQYAMIVLLASVFFGNFFLPIDTLYPWARVVSFALPITYGTIAFQQIMLRGAALPLLYPAALGVFAVGTFLLGTLLFRRELRRAG